MPTGVYARTELHNQHIRDGLRKAFNSGKIRRKKIRVKKICLVCKNIFEVILCRKDKAKYCSKKCMGIGYRTNKDVIDFIKENFDKLTNKEIGEKLSLTKISIDNLCFNYNIKKNSSKIQKRLFEENLREKPIGFLGKHHTIETRKKISDAGKGRKMSQGLKNRLVEINKKKMKNLWKNKEYRQMQINKHKGIKQSEETINKRIKAYKEIWKNPEFRRRQSNSHILAWQNDKIRKKQLNAIFKGMNINPNKPETFLNNLLQQNFPNKFEYTGDGKVIIGGFCPDFVCNPSKRIIELYGDYWHNLESWKKRDQRRLEAYKRYGFSTLIIWEHELKNPTLVTDKILEFINLC